MSTQFYKATATLLALSATLAGCASTSPQFDRNFGTSVRASIASQVSDSAAASNANPVMGIDGGAARAARQQYEHSFAQPKGQEPAMTTGSRK